MNQQTRTQTEWFILCASDSDCAIVQLAADAGGCSFSTHVRPDKPIDPAATLVHELTWSGDQMEKNGVPVPTMTLVNALHAFFSWLESACEGRPVILIAHNCRNFDSCVLLRAVQSVGLLDKLKERVSGFADSLPMFQQAFPNLNHHTQEGLYSHCFGEVYNAHDACGDVQALKRLFEHAGFSSDMLQKHSFSLLYWNSLLAGNAVCHAGSHYCPPASFLLAWRNGQQNPAWRPSISF
jgi:DNA polymerase III alpha subunit (gram-positive type)